jgi:hypothetical protein
MPTYTIQLEDGRKVKVQANSPSDALAEANGFAASNPRQKPNYTPPKRKMGTSDNLQTLAAQGTTFGQLPRIMGAMGTVMGVPDAIRKRSLAPIGEAYRQNRQAEIDRIDQARAQTGLFGAGAEMIGGLATGGAIAKAGGQLLARVAPKAAPRVAAALAPRAGSAAGKVARATGRTGLAAGGGAASGAVYGSGEGRAVENALYGAVGGAVAEPIIRVGGATVRGARRLVGRDKTKPEVVAARKIVERLSHDAQARIDEAARLGLDPLSVVDVSRNSGRRMVRGVASASDGGQEIALNYRTQTREALPDRAQGIVRQMTGGDVDFPSAQAAAQANIKAVDDFNYGPIQNQRIMVTPEMLQSLRPADAQAAIANARRVAELSGRQDDVAALDTITNILQTGDVSRMQGLEVSTPVAEQIYRSIRDTTADLYSNAGTRSVGQAMSGLRNEFDTALQAQSPQIAQARAASREARQGAEALDVGFGGFAPSRLPSALANDVGALPQSARPNVLAGGQAQLQQRIGENPFATINALGFRPNMAARLNAMGAPTENMTRSAQIEVGRARTADFISPNTGSQTQLRATDMADIGAVPVTPMGWATKLMDFAFRRINAFTEAEMEALVRMGVEPADLPRLQALAARDPDQIPSIVKGLIGSQVGIQTGNQSNAMARYQAGQ